MVEFEQYAALPFLETNDGLLVCLITSRDTGRWVIPKGWAKPSLAPCELAATEARQEAGLVGTIVAQPLGTFRYEKRLHIFSTARCRVTVFALAVEAQRLTWREQGQRRLEWMRPAAAAANVNEADLGRLISDFPKWLACHRDAA